jgi:lipoprotein LprG
MRTLRLLLVPFFALALALALVACGGGSDSQPSSGGGSSPGPNPQELIRKAAAASKAAKTFHFNFTQDKDATMPMPLGFRLVSAEGDYQAPDRIKAAVKAKAASANISVNVAGIGERTWITNPFTRRWEALPDTSVADIADPVAIVNALLAGLKDPKIAGEAEVDGVKTYRVTGTIDSSVMRDAFATVEGGFTNNVELWLGVDDSLPRRAKIAGKLYKDDPEGVTRQVELSKFNAPVDIQQPA